MQATENKRLIEQTVNITSAFVASNSLDATELAGLLQTTFSTLLRLKKGKTPSPAPPAVELTPAVAIKDSVHGAFIICLEDGKKFKSMKRHLRAHHNMTPEAYRAKWGLPREYPLTAADYSKKRAALANQIRFSEKPAAARKKGRKRT